MTFKFVTIDESLQKADNVLDEACIWVNRPRSSFEMWTYAVLEKDKQ